MEWRLRFKHGAKLVLLTIVLLTVLCSSGCKKRLSGEYFWKDPTAASSDVGMTLNFKKDGTYIDSLTSLVGTYEIKGNEITLYFEALGMKEAHKGTIKRDTIIIPGLFSNQPMEFKKVK